MTKLDDRNSVNVGVIGFSKGCFDVDQAKSLIYEAFEQIAKEYTDKPINCVSGWTDLGIPALAYREARFRGWPTIGIACERAKEYNTFDCDEGYICGQEWGDESNMFLQNINVILKFGGGKQSEKEFASAIKLGIPYVEFELPKEKEEKE